MNGTRSEVQILSPQQSYTYLPANTPPTKPTATSPVQTGNANSGIAKDSQAFSSNVALIPAWGAKFTQCCQSPFLLSRQ